MLLARRGALLRHAGTAPLRPRQHSTPQHACGATRLASSAAPSHQAPLGSGKQLPRFYAPSLPPAPGASVALDADEARHLRVLRLGPGDAVELADGAGSIVACEVAAADKGGALVTALSAPQQLPWAGPRWVVAAACSTLKGGRTDWLVEKATELGAWAVAPLITERSQTGTSKAKFRHGQRCYLLVGPEGDFTPRELQQLEAAGVLGVGLGPSRLRSETAAMAVLSAAVLFADAAEAAAGNRT